MAIHGIHADETLSFTFLVKSSLYARYLILSIYKNRFA